MDLFSGDISTLVFKGSVKGDLDDFSLDSRMLKVLVALNGKKNLASVAQSVNMSMEALKEVLTRLHHIHLIEKVEADVPMLNDDFFNFLKNHLTLAIGPIAEFIIEDEIQDLSNVPGQLPFHRAAELVNLLASQIPRPENKVVFQQAMANKIKETKP